MMKKKIRLTKRLGITKKHFIKKLFALFLTTSFLGSPCTKLNAAVSPVIKEESFIELEERVFEEIQTGKITNDADVIKIALKQYHERKNQAATISEPGQKIDIDDSLSITQVLSHEIDESGNITENIISTTLIVLDDNDNVVNAREIYSFDTDKYGELGQYSIYATMSVNYSTDCNPNYDSVRFNYFDTTLYYGTAAKATKLVQTSSFKRDFLFEYDDITKNIIDPQANVRYHYVPSNREFIKYTTQTAGRICKSLIYVGSLCMGFRFLYTCERVNDGKGTWEFAIE